MFSILRSGLRTAFLCTFSLLPTALLAQSTIHVGSNQPFTTIQAGIDAAATGDTVLVDPGTYNEHIDFKGKAITVTSSGGASVTSIDGGNKPGVATVLFVNAETSASVISGFTIRGGGNTIYSGRSNGGIYVGEASPIIKGNIITANYCHNIDVEFGVATILNNEISGVLQDNQGSGTDESYCTFGSAIFLGGVGNITNGQGNVVVGNTIENNLTGSAISMWAADYVLIMNNIIRENTSPDTGSAFTEANSVGTVIAQNLIYKNTSGCGGAIQFEEPLFIANNTIVDNVMTQTLTAASNCTYIAQIYPGGYSYGSSSPGSVIINNIISGSTSYPAVNCSWFDPPSEANQPTFKNNILYNAGGPFFGSFCIDVSDKYNNIAADPQFVNPATGDYHLKSTSPAIDSGDNTALQTYSNMTGVALSKDFGGNARVQDATGKGCIIDIGAYEVHGTRSLCGTSETLTSSLNPAMAGQNVTFTAHLTAGSGTPTGSIDFLDGANLLSTQTVSGSGAASYSTGSLTVGSHVITANYRPTGDFNATTASLTQVIDGETTGTALTCTPNPIDISNTAQFTATVTSSFGTPEGSVAFADDGVPLGTIGLTAGKASLTYTGSIAETHTITATYRPTGSFAGSSGTCAEVVNPLPTTSTLAVAPPSSTYGFPVTLTATVAPVTPPGPSIPGGTVTFYDGATAIGTATLAGGVSSLVTSSLSGGSHHLTCAYGGSSIYAASNCNTLPLVINVAPTALTISSSNNPASYLSPVTFTVRLTVSGQSAGLGNIIRLGINGQVISLTTDAAGSATYAMGTLDAGSYPVAATFAATNNLLASSASLTEVITADPTSTTLNGTPNPGDLNQSVTLTAKVSSQSTPVGSGSVTFYDGSASLGSSALAADGTATLTAALTTLGTHKLTATYSGTVDFSPSTSAVLNETIIPGDFSITTTPKSTSMYTGEAATVQVSVASLNGFNQPLALSCSGLPANATCAFTPSTLPNGQGAAKLVIQTAAPHKTVVASALGALVLLLFPGLRRRRRNFLASLCAVLLAVGVAFGIGGCGGDPSLTGGTPAGTYQISVTASTTGTATPLTHSAVVNLTVKSLF